VPNTADFQDLTSEPWVPILHLDIKSDNVMLLKENKEYPSYPKPVLGDFNLSHVNNSDFQDRLSSVDGPRFDGTDGWQPPVSVLAGGLLSC
jgi:serine/threonine protein kinase